MFDWFLQLRAGLVKRTGSSAILFTIDLSGIPFLIEAMSEFQTLAKVGDIPEGQGRSFACNGTMIGVFLSGGQYFAINDFCPHMGASLADGYVEDSAVSCPWHAWRFSLKDGTWLDNSKSGIRSACYEVRVFNEEIQVKVPPAPTPASSQPTC